MNNNSFAVKAFADHISRNGHYALSCCGITTGNQFVFGLSVAPADQRRLLGAMQQHPVLSGLTEKTIVTREDVTPFYTNVHAASAPIAPSGDIVKALPGNVTIALSSNGMLSLAAHKDAEQPYGLVSSVDPYMQLRAGVAKVVAEAFGPHYRLISQQNPIFPGECFTYHCPLSGKPTGLSNCRSVHNLLLTLAVSKEYQLTLKNALFNLFEQADHQHLSRVFSPLVGCGTVGGTGETLAQAVFDASREFENATGKKMPELILVGMSSSDTDRKACSAFLKAWETLNSPAPHPRPMATPPADISYLADKASALTVSTTPNVLPTGPSEVVSDGGKDIDCGICGESKPEKSAKQVKGLQVCSDCAEDYQDGGVNLSEVARLGEEYTAIQYDPLQIRYDSRDLPGYPGTGRIIVHIAATAPPYLSNGRRVVIFSKAHNHYLPNNAIGMELLRLLQIMHTEKLLYKIDDSHTLGRFGITFNFHLKTSDSGGEENHGYPDPNYPGRALNEIIGLAETHSLKDKLDTSRLMDLIQKAKLV